LSKGIRLSAWGLVIRTGCRFPAHSGIEAYIIVGPEIKVCLVVQPSDSVFGSPFVHYGTD